MNNEMIRVFLEFKENMSQGLAGVDAKLKGFQSNIDKLQGALTPLSLISGATIGAAVNAAAEWSKASSGAARGLDLAGKDLEKFKAQTEDLAKKLNFQKSSTELLRLSTEVGKLGIVVKDVPAYTENLVKLATATDKLNDIDELGKDIAKIGSVFKFTTKDVEEFGASVNKLDDISSATSTEILNFTKRISGIAATSKLSAKEVSAWGATLISSGQAPNVAATFMNKFLTVMGAAEAQTEKVQNAFHELGFSGKELAIMFDKDASGTLQKFLGKLRDLDTVSRRKIVAQIFGQEHVDSASQLLAVYDKLIPNIKQANDVAGNVAKMNREFDQLSNQSLEGQLNTVKNQFVEIGKTLGLTLLPSIVSINKQIIPMLNGFLEFAKTHPNVTKIGVALLGMVAVAAPLVSLVNTFVTLGFVLPVIATGTTGLLTGMVALIPGAIAATVALGTAIWTAFLPIAPFVAGIAAIAGGAYLIWKNWEPIKGWFRELFSIWGRDLNNLWAWMSKGINSSFNSMSVGINNWSNNFANSINRTINNSASGFNNWVNSLGNGFNSMFRWIYDAFNNLANAAWNWGSNFINNFVNGIRANINNAANAVANMTAEMGKYLPHSPSEKGAFRDLDKTGFAFTDTFLNGIKQSGLDTFFDGMFKAPKNNLGLSTPSPRNQNNNESVQLVYSPVITGSKNDADFIMNQLKSKERELLDIIDKALRKSNRKFY
jgi:TP901 family phage tail tape measure protein